MPAVSRLRAIPWFVLLQALSAVREEWSRLPQRDRARLAEIVRDARSTRSLSPRDREDLRRAKAALATALDPQGNGQRVVWQNPQTGSHGAFTASAPPFADQDRVCRAFSGEVSQSEAGDRHLTGSACRDADGSWVLRPAGGSAKA